MKNLTFAIASNNRNKILELQNYFANSVIELLTPKQLNLEFDVEETGNTFQENAAIKSEKLFKITNIPSIADDSGLCVDAMGGEPGVFSARYGKENFNDKERAYFLLEQMKNEKNRLCHYECVISFTTKNRTNFFHGLCFGEIAYDYDETGFGFGYDPVFYYPPFKKRFSQITREEKAIVSHRGLAMKRFQDYISTSLKIDHALK